MTPPPTLPRPNVLDFNSLNFGGLEVGELFLDSSSGQLASCHVFVF